MNSLSKLFNYVSNYKITWKFACLFIIADIVLCFIIIKKVNYTEIDWIAYMQEVEGYLSGERDYTKLKGDTGPLVYPAGFLYVFSALRSLTDSGTNILTAQFIFAGVYIVNLAVVLLLYVQGSVPLVLASFLILSKRVHSIYMLRMFNDCIAVLFGYIAIYLFTKSKYRWGCLLYSFGVSIKMNMLLYAPGVLLILLMATGFNETIVCLSICAGLQVVLGLPFLTTYPVEYISKSFELGRVFMHKWTVNYRFVPEQIFVGKTMSITLLVATIIGFIVFARKWIVESNKELKENKPASILPKIIGVRRLSSDFICSVIFTSNLIGVVFARSLHYQFYCWYFHTLPYLLARTNLPLVVKGALLIGIEVSFNVFPSTWWSSLLLQVCHVVLLVALYVAPTPAPVTRDNSNAKKTASKVK